MTRPLFYRPDISLDISPLRFGLAVVLVLGVIRRNHYRSGLVVSRIGLLVTYLQG